MLHRRVALLVRREKAFPRSYRQAVTHQQDRTTSGQAGHRVDEAAQISQHDAVAVAQEPRVDPDLVPDQLRVLTSHLETAQDTVELGLGLEGRWSCGVHRRHRPFERRGIIAEPAQHVHVAVVGGHHDTITPGDPLVQKTAQGGHDGGPAVRPEVRLVDKNGEIPGRCRLDAGHRRGLLLNRPIGGRERRTEVADLDCPAIDQNFEITSVETVDRAPLTIGDEHLHIDHIHPDPVGE